MMNTALINYHQTTHIALIQINNFGLLKIQNQSGRNACTRKFISIYLYLYMYI